MLVGVPKEIKDNENRVGLIPSTVRELTHKGHRVLVETNAGFGAGLIVVDAVLFSTSLFHASVRARAPKTPSQ